MYDFIFYFVYTQNLAKSGESGAKAFGAILAYFVILGQLAALFMLFQFFYEKSTGTHLLEGNSFNPSALPRNILVIFLAVGFMFLLYRYYSRNIDSIKKKFHNKNKKEFATSANVLKFLLIFVIPWIIVIIFG
jgi:hypothetical protein